MNVLNRLQQKALSQRERELILGNLVTWGCIFSAVALAIAFVPLLAAETEHNALTSSAEAHQLKADSDQS